MKFAIFASMVILLGAGSAFAAEEPSGRPSAVLDDVQCQEVWKVESDGDALRNDRVPMLNFPLADNDKNGEISEAEFKEACKLGWVAYSPTGTGKSASSMQPSTPSQP